MIPKLIHQIYFGFDGAIENKPIFKKSVESIKEIMPKWEYKIWDDTLIRNLIANKMPNFLAYYENLKYVIQKVDIGRYIILLHEGGFYIDMDIIVKKKFDDLVNNDLLFYTYNKNNRNYEIDFIGSSKHNNFWLEILKESLKVYEQKSKIQIYNAWKARFVMQTTGPYFFDKAIKKIKPKHTRLNLIKSNESEGDYAYNFRSHTWGKY